MCVTGARGCSGGHVVLFSAACGSSRPAHVYCKQTLPTRGGKNRTGVFPPVFSEEWTGPKLCHTRVRD